MNIIIYLINKYIIYILFKCHVYILCLQNLYYQSPRNPNLIAIVPVDERSVLQQSDLTCSVEKTASNIDSYSAGM